MLVRKKWIFSLARIRGLARLVAASASLQGVPDRTQLEDQRFEGMGDPLRATRTETWGAHFGGYALWGVVQ